MNAPGATGFQQPPAGLIANLITSVSRVAGTSTGTAAENV
jgi:hypothetical protein